MDARSIAEPNTILQGTVGSTTHGLALAGADDFDEMGVCTEPRKYVVGFGRFEQWVYRTAAEREGRDGAKSGPGDIDLIVYSLRKWARLALQGNPTVILLLYLPDGAVRVRTEAGRELQSLWQAFASRKAGDRFLGYLMAQRQRLVGERGQRDVNRPALVEAYGYDTKYAMHMLRLGHQGVEFLKEGRLTLPMREAVRGHLMDVRQGRVDLRSILDEADALVARLQGLLGTSPLPPEPETARVEEFVLKAYEQAWGVQEAATQLP